MMGWWMRIGRRWGVMALVLLTAASVWAGNVSPLIHDSGTHVGIGTTGPFSGKLHIHNPDSGQALFARTSATAGTNYGLDVEATGAGATMNVAGYFHADGAETNIGIEIGGPPAGPRNYAVLSRTSAASFWAGPVGLGTPTPAERLHVRGSDVAALIEGNGTSTASLKLATNSAVRWRVGTGGGGANLTFSNQSGTTVAFLDQGGGLTLSGNVAARYQDVAEWVPAPPGLTAGTVVVVDPKIDNRVMEAETAYDVRLAGVVSARPGVLLGEAGADKAQIAHVGRVKVKVDASYGAIARGDLLVTSPTTGHAMRSVPIDVNGTSIHRPGTVLGKALEPLADGRGEILVLLSFQ